MVAISTDQGPTFDPAALREKYRIERDRRVRADGKDQYVETTGQFEHYLDDPYADPSFTRAPVVEDVEVLIAGGGFGGLLSAARLQEAGVTSFRIVERAGDFGGTWYWNRYPGAACDTESYIYMPLLEETGYLPTQKYAKGPGALRALPADSDVITIFIRARSSRPRFASSAGMKRPTAGRSRPIAATSSARTSS